MREEVGIDILCLVVIECFVDIYESSSGSDESAARHFPSRNTWIDSSTYDFTFCGTLFCTRQGSQRGFCIICRDGHCK